MKKILILGSAVLLAATGVAPSSAAAAPLINLGVSMPKVFEATEVTFTPNLINSAGVSPTLLKYEVVRLSAAEASLSLESRQIAGSNCAGDVQGAGAGYQTCSFDTGVQRVTIGAGAASVDVNVFSGSYLRISALVSQPTVFAVRAWLDWNDDSTRDAFEPYSAEVRLEVLPVEMARGSLAYQFEPPLLGGSNLKARVYNNGVVGAMLNSSKIQYRAFETTPNGNRQVSGTLSVNWHPQLSAYEFSALSTELRYPAVYTAQLVFERTPGNYVVLASERYDYRALFSVKIDTEVVASSENVFSRVKESFTERVTIEGKQGKFAYRMRLTNPNGEPVSGQDVYFFVDLFDLANPQAVTLNGSSLIDRNALVDQVLLKRTTNSRGEIIMNFDNSSTSNLGSMEIDYRVNGLQSASFEGGSKHRVTWAERAPKISTFASSGGARTLTLPFGLYLADGRQATEVFDVYFTAEYPVQVSSPLITAATWGVGEVTLSRLISGSGSSLVTAMLVGRDGQVSEGFWRVDWGQNDGYGMTGSPLAVRPREGLRITKTAFLPGTKILEVEGQALNGFGSPILNSLEEKTVEVEATVAGLSLGSEAVPIAYDGSFRAFLSLYPAESEQEVTISAALFRKQVALVSVSCVAPVANCETRPYVFSQPDENATGNSSGGSAGGEVRAWTRFWPDALKIYARDVVGAGKVQFFVNGREIAWVRAISSADPKLNVYSDGMGRTVLLRDMLPGRNVFEIYLEGERILRRIVTKT